MAPLCARIRTGCPRRGRQLRTEIDGTQPGGRTGCITGGPGVVSFPARCYPARPMHASVRWINDYLDRPAAAEEQAELLTRAGFPLQSSTPMDDGDVCMDVETTSNRGDCVSHLGLAREIAAMSGRALRPPVVELAAKGPPASGTVKVTNLEKEKCPLYTARIIRRIKVGPSPDWLAARLRAVGQIPRNNVVDATNFVLLELGQPTHVFDLAKLKGPEIIVRMAREGEAFLPIGEGAAEVKLSADDLVIADARDAVAIAGVKGGAKSAVTSATTDILIEAATFDPVTVRRTSRRLQIASDSSYRFERGVHAAQVNAAADRLAALILETAGGALGEGVVADGAPIPGPRFVSLRPDRCRQLLGVDVSDDQITRWLALLGFDPRLGDGMIQCTAPVERIDIEREVDLIEEVARMLGTENIPLAETISIRVAPPQGEELARRAVCEALAGMGYVETLTHTLIAESAAKAFLVPGADLLMVADDRAGAEPALRPSILPSLLRVRAHNKHQGAHELKLFECAAVFWQERSEHHEQLHLALLADLEDGDSGLRPLRGAIERVIAILLGADASVELTIDSSVSWYSTGAAVNVNGSLLGRAGILHPNLTAMFDLDEPMATTELHIGPLLKDYPPLTIARAMPAFPAIERDISAILAEPTTWREVQGVIDAVGLHFLEAMEFVTTYRGKQIGAGRKSLTVRLRFRAADRTLTHDEVDPQAAAAVAALKENLGAEVRT